MVWLFCDSGGQFLFLDTGASSSDAALVDNSTYLVEPFRSSSVVRKFSGTLGVTADHDKLAMTIMSFSHFVMEYTACTMAMADLQGKFIRPTPQLTTFSLNLDRFSSHRTRWSTHHVFVWPYDPHIDPVSFVFRKRVKWLRNFLQRQWGWWLWMRGHPGRYWKSRVQYFLQRSKFVTKDRPRGNICPPEGRPWKRCCYCYLILSDLILTLTTFYDYSYDSFTNFLRLLLWLFHDYDM
jgi:hypothetical protein